LEVEWIESGSKFFFVEIKFLFESIAPPHLKKVIFGEFREKRKGKKKMNSGDNNTVRTAFEGLSIEQNPCSDLSEKLITYHRGMLVGVVCAYVDQDLDFDTALSKAFRQFPKDVVKNWREIFPDSWRDALDNIPQKRIENAKRISSKV